jgi:hypothetical protein
MEQKLTHWKILVNPLYIGAYMVQSDLTVKITKVVREIVKGENGKSEECTVAYLEGTKPLILNRTNSKTITKLYGTPYIEEWVGKWITIYPTTTKVAGEIVECLRIRTTVPTGTTQPKPVDYTNQAATLRNCADLAGLKFEFEALDKKAQAALFNVKEECKIKLSAQ